MPALSTQTQLASLRGALEAARLREEKNKLDMERYLKEMEVLRWENVNWRRGEGEVGFFSSFSSCSFFAFEFGSGHPSLRSIFNLFFFTLFNLLMVSMSLKA